MNVPSQPLLAVCLCSGRYMVAGPGIICCALAVVVVPEAATEGVGYSVPCLLVSSVVVSYTVA